MKTETFNTKLRSLQDIAKFTVDITMRCAVYKFGYIVFNYDAQQALNPAGRLRPHLYGLGYPRQPFSRDNFIERLYD